MKEPLEHIGQLDSSQPGNRGDHTSSQVLQDTRQAVQEHHRALMEHYSILQALFEKMRDAQQRMQEQHQSLQNFYEALQNHHLMGESYRHWEENHYQTLTERQDLRTE